MDGICFIFIHSCIKVNKVLVAQCNHQIKLPAVRKRSNNGNSKKCKSSNVYEHDKSKRHDHQAATVAPIIEHSTITGSKPNI